MHTAPHWTHSILKAINFKKVAAHFSGVYITDGRKLER